jgi:hypothetical protein
MKLLCAAKLEEVDIIKGLPAEEGIACEVTNDTIPYPGPVFDPKLWVADDADFSRASAVLKDFRKSPAPKLSPWTCPACGEQSEGQFSSCWKCGAARSGPG